MSASAHCHHPDLVYQVATVIDEDREGFAYAQITAARCEYCGRRWRFVGVSSDKDPDAPTANRDATMVAMPMMEISS